MRKRGGTRQSHYYCYNSRQLIALVHKAVSGTYAHHIMFYAVFHKEIVKVTACNVVDEQDGNRHVCKLMLMRLAIV